MQRVACCRASACRAKICWLEELSLLWTANTGRMIGASAARRQPQPGAAERGSFVDEELPLRGRAAKRGRFVDWEFPLRRAAKRGILIRSFCCAGLQKERPLDGELPLHGVVWVKREQVVLAPRSSFCLPLRGPAKGGRLTGSFCCVGLLPCLFVACEHQGLTKEGGCSC